MMDNPQSPLPDEPQSTFADEEPRSELVIYDRSWQEIWQMAITSPTVDTYRDILRDRNVDLVRALVWLYASFVVSYIINIVASVMVGSLKDLPSSSGTLLTPAGLGIIGIICTPILALLAVAILMIPLTIVHVLARYLLGGTGDFATTIFAIAAFYAPLTIIGAMFSFLGFIPILAYIPSIGIYLYMAWLGVVAMMAAHQFGWLQGAIAWLAIPALFMCCIIVIVIIALSSQGTNDVFQNIVNTLEATPIGQ